MSILPAYHRHLLARGCSEDAAVGRLCLVQNKLYTDRQRRWWFANLGKGGKGKGGGGAAPAKPPEPVMSESQLRSEIAKADAKLRRYYGRELTEVETKERLSLVRQANALRRQRQELRDSGKAAQKEPQAKRESTRTPPRFASVGEASQYARKNLGLFISAKLMKDQKKAAKVVTMLVDQLDSMRERFAAVRELQDRGGPAGVLSLADGKSIRSRSGSDSSGIYNAEDDRIRLAGSLPLRNSAKPVLGGFNVSGGRDVAATFRHEYGHRVWHRQMGGAAVSEWNQAARQYLRSGGFSKKKHPVSVYGSSSNTELFAETFAAYTHPGYQRGQLPADLERFMDRHIKGNPDGS